jgi:hypothetical protein
MEIPAETNPVAWVLGPFAPMNQSSGALWASYPAPRELILNNTPPPLFFFFFFFFFFASWSPFRSWS